MASVLMDGDFLVHQDAKPLFLYVVLEGTVEIAAGPKQGAKVYIDSRGPGTVVGEQAFIEKREHSADVRARGQAKVLKIPAAVVDLLFEDIRFVRNLLTAESAKVRLATQQRYKITAQNELLFSHFRSHVDSRIVDGLLTQGEDYGKPQRIDPGFVMFCDLRDFTRLSVNLSELEVANQLGPYFASIVERVHESAGLVDKFIGDAVMAVWGHPALGPVDPNNILDACITMIKSARTLQYGGEPIRLGIGLNAGVLFMGNVGSEERRSFTVLGDPVNLASRYESANKSEDGRIYSITVGPVIHGLLDPAHQALLSERVETHIKGAAADVQTTYSMQIVE